MEYDWKNLTAPLPDDIRMLKENGSWDRELAAIDKRLERELPETLRQRLLIEKEITARLRLEYTYSWEDAVRLMSEELTQFDPSELEYYQNEGTADWHFVDGKVYFQKRFFRTLLKTKPEIRGKWKHLEADPVDDQEQKMLMETIREMQEKGEAAYRIHARCTLRVEDEAFRPGETLKVHLPLPALAQQVPEVKLLKITPEPRDESIRLDKPVMLGGPLAEDRGFILHTPPSNFASSIRISDNTVMTTSRDVLETLGTDKQPSDVLVALGYASWEKGQLEQEILDNAWLTAPADLNILFKTPIADRWREAAKLIGVDILTMPGVAGHA